MELTFQLGNEIIIVRIMGRSILFSDSHTNFQQFFPIEGLKFSREGILKEHPDLKNLSDGEMRIEAIKRFKEHVRNLGGENEIKKYITDELEGCGYSLILIKKEGFRPIKVQAEVK